MRILVNGMGCPFTGARFVLDQILNATPPEHHVTAIVPIVKGGRKFDYPPNVRIIALRHSIWGMFLRLPLEIWINVQLWTGRFDHLVNLSNYGLCYSKHQVLYIHNPYLLDLHAPTGFGQGHPNVLVRAALKTCLKNAECIFLQTTHMQRQLTEYCAAHGLKPKRVEVLRPPFPVPEVWKVVDPPSVNNQFFFFYPASPFIHKKTSLAIAGIQSARASDPRIRLTITIAPPESQHPEGINFLGLVSPEDVYRNFQQCHAMLFTSARETLGLPLLEAIWFGRPAVLPDLDYAREIFGDAGIYYDSETAESIAKAILRLKGDYDKAIELTRARKQELLKTQSTWPAHWSAFLGNTIN